LSSIEALRKKSNCSVTPTRPLRNGAPSCLARMESRRLSICRASERVRYFRRLAALSVSKL